LSLCMGVGEMSLVKPRGNLGGRNRFGAMTTERTYNGL